MLIALAALGARTILYLDSSFDTRTYHWAFAALRAGIPTSFTMSEHYQQVYDGFPPLADLAQGLLWRAFGTVNAVQLVNFLAFVGYLAYCHRVLRAAFWLVGLIALATPLVVIHMSIGYVDLFTNVLLAIGMSSALYLLLFPERASRAVFLGGLLGLTAACWSKYTILPLAVPLFLVYLPLGLRAGPMLRWSRPTIVLIILAAIAVAAEPYLRNFVLFGNPLWPVRVPLIGGLFPYVSDAQAVGAELFRPADLRDSPQWLVFIRSFFEVGVPTHYGFRPRWTLDQFATRVDTASGRNMGGFWNVAVVFYLGATLAALAAIGRRREWVAFVGIVTTLVIVALLPQSNELRYFMFIPLVWAAALAMLFPAVAERWPAVGSAFLGVALVLFGAMVWANRTYYTVKFASWTDAAVAHGAAALWPQLSPARSYCAVGIPGTAFMLTGPTMTEFSISSRETFDACPSGATIITAAGIQPQP